MKVYISGKISGEENYKEIFEQRARLLKETGFIPVNPVSIGERLRKTLGREPSYEEYLSSGIEALKDCYGITMLPNWEKSHGAKKEYEYAVKHNITFIEIYQVADGWEN